jgi:hypothetical protein
MEAIQTPNPPSFETVWAALQETDRILKESSAELNKKLGKYINLFGEVTEYEMAPKMREKFIEFGFTFPKAERNVNIMGRLEKMRNYADLHGDKRMFLGADAGVVVTD